jgi:hypothetical protein
MSIPENIPNRLLNHLEPPLQESGSLLGKVVTKVHTTTNYAISSISSVAQFILSSCISVGTLGRYTLDDLKDYFSTTDSLEDISAVSSKGDAIEEASVSESDRALKETKSKLQRHDSKMSVNSTTLRRIRSPRDSDSSCSSLYPNLEDTVKLSTHPKNPKERLAEMEESAINRGK